MKAIRVLVVDDSATMRTLITRIASSDASIDVVGHASDPFEAREAIKRLKPDVVTLDIEMPNMNGIEFLKRLMRLHPLPVIMVSTLTQKGASETVEALAIGAVDCISKPSIDYPDSLLDLPEKIHAAARAKFTLAQKTTAAPSRGEVDYRSDGRVVAIGASTGGVEALIEVISNFPKNCPPTMITLHMPAMFTRSFAKRLDSVTSACVSEAVAGAPLEVGQVYLAPGCDTHLVVSSTVPRRCVLLSGDRVNGHRPSVDMLFNSVAAAFGKNAIGVILTGMGRDGAHGLAQMRQAGARTLAQDEATSVVFGMPKVALETGAAERALPIKNVAREILALTNVTAKRTA